MDELGKKKTEINVSIRHFIVHNIFFLKSASNNLKVLLKDCF